MRQAEAKPFVIAVCLCEGDGPCRTTELGRQRRAVNAAMGGQCINCSGPTDPRTCDLLCAACVRPA